MVQKEEEEATLKAQKTQEIADSAQRDLDEALPALVRYIQHYQAALMVSANHSLITIFSAFETSSRVWVQKR